METKLTLNKKNNFFISSISKLVVLITTSLSKKTSVTTYRIIAILVLVFSTSITFGQSSPCQAKLIVDNNLNVGSSSPEGTYYSMVITNTGTSPDVFSLSSININSICSNTDGSSNTDNVNLETTFVDISLSPINEISLNAGQSINFYSHITIPLGTTIKKWCCTQVIAESKTCSNYKASTVLHTYFSGPNED
jgi:hypothetical protein